MAKLATYASVDSNACIISRQVFILLANLCAKVSIVGLKIVTEHHNVVVL